MTRDDIIRWARQAGIKLPDGAFPDQGSFTLPNLIQFAGLVAAAEREACAAKLQSLRAQAYRDGHKAGKQAEREACAKACETQYPYSVMHTDQRAATNCAAAIRARGQT
jgi:hypothetical protein